MEWTFVSWDFVTALISIIMLDILLGGDNAVVIAMAANKLPAALRRKAILIGTGGAVIIRLVMTLIAVWLLTIPYLQVLGGLILLPIAVKLLLPAEHNEQINASDNLMGAIRPSSLPMRLWASIMYWLLPGPLMAVFSSSPADFSSVSPSSSAAVRSLAESWTAFLLYSMAVPAFWAGRRVL